VGVFFLRKRGFGDPKTGMGLLESNRIIMSTEQPMEVLNRADYVTKAEFGKQIEHS
jgi:hypothetical protein